MWLHRTLIPLLVGALALPIVIVLLLGVGRLMAALGDTAAAAVFDALLLTGGVLWTADLIALVIIQALLAAESAPRQDQSFSELADELESDEP